MRLALLALVTCAALCATTRAIAAPAQPVEFKSGDISIKAVLFTPEGPGPFPAVVGLHGCEGLNGPGGVLSPHYREWADRLGKAGFAVLYPDSFGPRGIETQCRSRGSVLRASRQRVADANAARVWLQQQPFVKPDRVSLAGWSSGGTNTLWAVRTRARAKDGKPDFRSAVAFYPGCTRLDALAWAARVPTLILIGGADDLASARQCEKMVANARGRSARVSFVVYPGAYHGFDHPHETLQVRSGYALSANASGRVHTGTNVAARNDALRRVPQWLAR